MNKVKRIFEIKYGLNWEEETKISRIRADLDEIEKLGATHVNIEHGIDFDCDFVEITSYAKRLETDEEYLERTTEQSEREIDIKKKELEQLKRLKEKYEKWSI